MTATTPRHFAVIRGSRKAEGYDQSGGERMNEEWGNTIEITHNPQPHPVKAPWWKRYRLSYEPRWVEFRVPSWRIRRNYTAQNPMTSQEWKKLEDDLRQTVLANFCNFLFQKTKNPFTTSASPPIDSKELKP